MPRIQTPADESTLDQRSPPGRRRAGAPGRPPPNTALLRVAAMLRREADKREDVQLARTMRVPLSAVRSLRAQGRRS